MLNLTTAQALSIWTELLLAEFGRNGFGSDTAEIYAYRLQPRNPTAELAQPGSDMHEEAIRDQALIASRNLYEILSHFRDVREVDMFVNCGRFDDGKPLGEWLLTEHFVLRTQVRIKARK